MKNIYEVLRQKELEIERLKKEIEALRVVAPMLMEEKDQVAGMSSQVATKPYSSPQTTTEQPLASDSAKAARVWP